VGGANFVGVFRVKNHDFTSKNHIFSNFRGWGARTRLDPPAYKRFNIHLILIRLNFSDISQNTVLLDIIEKTIHMTTIFLSIDIPVFESLFGSIYTCVSEVISIMEY
jgi:hypothetical protein